jgi:hypothetical protein
VSTIAKIEIPRKEWMDLIHNLSSNSTNADINIRLAAIQTLQFICEEMFPEDFTPE